MRIEQHDDLPGCATCVTGGPRVPGGDPGGTTWAWQLDQTGTRSTRLLTRVRSSYQWFSPSIAFSMLVEFGDIWMMRKTLLNLRKRAGAAS